MNITPICLTVRVVDGIEDNDHTFQFNMEQSEAKTNVAGKVSENCMINEKL